MRKIKGKLGILLFGLVGLFNTSHATLNDLGNGLVNDDVLNITWMQDANLFKTLCDANDPIATGFTPVDTADAATVCTNNGQMTWNDAEAWMARLNAQSYLGFTDWRQPLTAQPDPACSIQSVNAGFPDQGFGYNCANVGSELNHLFYTSLINPNNQDDGCFGAVPHCFQNTAPFSNPQSFYWSGSEFAPLTIAAWVFGTDNGFQGRGDKSSDNLFVWPVRSGQSVVAPITPQQIPTLSVWGLGIMSLLLAFVARRKVR